MNHGEVFKDIPNTPNFQISNFGRVIRRAHTVINKRGIRKYNPEYFIKAQIDTHGYWSVKIKGKHYNLHRLIAILFIPNPENKKTVNHKDGNKLNMSLDNLEWATQSENNQHAYSVLKKIGSFTGKKGHLHHRSKSVIVYDLEMNEKYRFESLAAGETHFNYPHSLPYFIKKNIPYKGHYWRYA